MFNTRARMWSYIPSPLISIYLPLSVCRPYTRGAHKHLESVFGSERTKLICGDSTQTLRDYTPDNTFDAVFIDGGHLHFQASADLSNGARKTKTCTL